MQHTEKQFLRKKSSEIRNRQEKIEIKIMREREGEKGWMQERERDPFL